MRVDCSSLSVGGIQAANSSRMSTVMVRASCTSIHYDLLTSPESLAALLDHEQGYANPGMKCIKEEVLIIHNIDEAVICKQPVCRPGIKKYKRKSSKHELG